MARHFWKAVAASLVVATLLCDVAPAQLLPGRDNRQEARQARRGRTFRSTTIRSPDIGLWMGSSADAGLTVRDTAPQGAIAKVGFREGDRIVSVNGKPVTSERQFIDLLFAENLRDEKVEVVVRRDSRDHVLFVQPATFVEEYSAAQSDPFWDYGIVVDDRYTDRIVVLRVTPRSPAYYAGLRVGDVITTFGGQRITSVADFSRQLAAGGQARVAIGVIRGNSTRELELDAPAAEGDVEGEARTTLKPNLDDPNARIEGRGKAQVEGELPNGEKPRLENPRDPRTPERPLEKSPVEKPTSAPKVPQPKAELP